MAPDLEAVLAGGQRPRESALSGNCRLAGSALCVLRGFRNGRYRAVRIPREFELPRNDAIMRKQGDRPILEPAPKHSIDQLLAVLDTLEDLPEDEQLPEIEDLPPEPFDL